MKKLMLNNGRAVACLILVCLFFVQGCKKDLLQPNSNVLEHGLSINEAKAYFNTHLQKANGPSKLMGTGALPKGVTLDGIMANKQPLWDYAYQKLISVGGAVKVPLDFGRVNIRVNGIKGMVPFGSLNYLLMYKDSLQNVHADWVYIMPDSMWLYGNRSNYTGKVIIKDWDGKVKKIYKYGKIKANLSATAGQNKFNPTKLMTPDPSISIIAPPDPPSCLVWPVREKCTCNLAFNGSNWYPDRCDYCDRCVDMVCMTPPTLDPGEPPTGGGTPGGSNGPGSGPGQSGSGDSWGPGPGDVAPNCDPTPGYVPPSYPAPEGEGWLQACGDDGIPVPAEPEDTEPVEPNYDFNIQPSDVTWSEFDGRFISYSELTEAIAANPDFVDAFDQENLVGPGLPNLPVFWTKLSAEAAGDCLNEAFYLRLMHPDWNINRVIAVAMWNTYSGAFHFVLDMAGLVPVIGEAADLANAGIYFVEGDHLNAAFSAAAAVPVYGWVSTGGNG